MVELLVMRHAKSSWSTPAVADFDRPLAPRGVNDAPRMAAWLVANDLLPDRIVASSALRVRMTVAPIVDAARVDAAFDDALYDATARDWLTLLAGETARRVLVCGHNPGLDMLVESLSPKRFPRTKSGKLMTTATIAHFVVPGPWSDLSPGAGELVSVIRPRDLLT